MQPWWVWSIFILVTAVIGIFVSTEKMTNVPFSFSYMLRWAGWMYFIVPVLSHVWHLFDLEVSLTCPGDAFFLTCSHSFSEYLNSYQVSVLAEILLVFGVIALARAQQLHRVGLYRARGDPHIIVVAPGTSLYGVYEILTLILWYAAIAVYGRLSQATVSWRWCLVAFLTRCMTGHCG